MIVKDISLIIPLNNEEAAISQFYSTLKDSLNQIGKSYEIIFVDDGSSDGTYNKLINLCSFDKNCNILKLDRNYGQSAALWIGINFAEGDIIISMDGDLQHDPFDLSKFIDKIYSGYDMVIGRRVYRADNFIIRRSLSLLGNKIFSLFFMGKLRDPSSSYRAFRKEIVKDIKPYLGLHRFMPLVVKKNISICEIKTICNKRVFGKAHYRFNRACIVIYEFFLIIFFRRGALNKYLYTITVEKIRQ